MRSRPDREQRSAGAGAEADGRTVRDLMTPGVVALPAEAPVREVGRALRAHHVHAILVVSSTDGSPLGWATADTMRHWRGERAASGTAKDAISEHVSGIDPDADVQAALYALSMPGVTRLVVRERGGGFPLGVITDFDLVDPSARGASR